MQQYSHNRLTCSIPEMAQILGISKSKAYPLARSDGFPTIKVGNRLIVSLRGLERWVAAQSGEEKLG